MHNLAQYMDDAMLTEIGDEVMMGFDDDNQSRTNWLDMHTYWLSLYMLSDYAENSDPERSWGATESVPLLTEACDQFQSRTYKIFFPNESFVAAVPMRRSKENRKELEDRAERIGRHMSYQLGFQDQNYKKDKDALFLGTAVHGSFFTKTYYNPKKKRFQVDNVRPTDLIINYNCGPIRIEDVSRKSHVIYTTVGATENMVADGYLVDSASPSTYSFDQLENTYNIKVDEVTGIDRSNSSIKRDEPSVLIEQHRYFDLDYQDGKLVNTGIFKPYIVTVDAAKRKALRIVIGYEAAPDGRPIKDYEQTQYFTHYKYKENPDGFYGLGLAHTMGDLNAAVNIMLRQSMDAATLANDGNMSGFISERLGLEGDEIRMVLGKFRKIPDTVGDLKNSLWTNQFPGPNPALIQLMEALDLRAQRLGSVTEATTGTIDKVVQPTTLLNQIEQALEQFSSVQMRIADALGDELNKIYKINQKYLPLLDYYVVNDAPEAITRMDYADDMLIQPIFDPRYTTQAQKVARAQAELEATMQNPVNQTRPQVYDVAFRRYFEALDVDNIEELIPPPPEMQRIDDQTQENMFFLMPPEKRPLFDVFPDQDHNDHLKKMTELDGAVDSFGIELTPEQQEAIFKHKQTHVAYLYGQIHGQVPGPISANAPQNGSGVSMDSQQAQGQVQGPAPSLLNGIMGGTEQNGGGANGSGVFG